MIDVYSARWNEKHKLLSLLWKLQGGLLTAESVLFGSFIKLLSMSTYLLELYFYSIDHEFESKSRFMYVPNQ